MNLLYTNSESKIVYGFHERKDSFVRKVHWVLWGDLLGTAKSIPILRSSWGPCHQASWIEGFEEDNPMWIFFHVI